MSRKNKDWLSGYLKFVEETEPPYTYKEWVGISVIASALRRKCYLKWGHDTLYPNMFVVLVGPPGKCRKGTAMGVGKAMLKEVGIQLAADSITREGLIRELSKATKADPDSTGKNIVMHSSLTVYSPELTVFLGYNNLNFLSILTDWFDCANTWEYTTKNMGQDNIKGVWLNLIGATTPELIQSALPKDAIGGGFASRVIFVYEENKEKVVPFPLISPALAKLHRDLIEDLDAIASMHGEFSITPEFMSLYADWYMAHSEKPPFNDLRFAGYNERRPTHLRKLCIILSASMRTDRIIDGEIFHRAISILDKVEMKMPMTFRGYGKSSMADVMANMMRTIATQGTVSKRTLLQLFYNDLEGERQLDLIIQTFVTMGFAKLRITPEATYLDYVNNGKNNY